MDLKSTKEFKQLSAKQALKLLEVDQKFGLSDQAAISRSKKYGLNEIGKKKKLSPLKRFILTFRDPLTLILLVAAALAGLTGEMKSLVIIVLMVILGGCLNFYQEYKSNRAAEQIAKKLTVRSTVLRDEQKKEILTQYLVPGDIFFLAAGDIMPADGYLLQSDDFFVNEAALTGESFPVEKTAEPDHLLYSGTNVISGYATVLALNTGARSEYGKIADSLSAPEETNAFELGIKSFGYLIVKAIVILVLIIFLINAFKEKSLIQSLIFSVAVAVGIAPELLPVILSVNMAKGSIRMAKHGVIVKRLNAIPDFGSMDILCTDKTGTLTEDRITLTKHIDVFGVETESVLRLGYLNGFFETGIKSPLDHAILNYKKISIVGINKVDEIPYDFSRKRSSIICEQDGQRLMISKGAPEEIFKICLSYSDGLKNKKLTSQQLKSIGQLYDDLSSRGFRVLAIATKKVADEKTVYARSEESGMNLAGFLVFYDPPKQSAKETIEFMAKHGIEVKILTGDSPLVTKKICEDLGIKITGIVSGEELDINKLNDDAIAVKAMASNILARLTPSQKNRVISVLRAKGFVVGYLGDGINDAPSLKNADVGISVENAVDVAKETADIILMKKGLQELMEGVIEGRKAFGNTMKYMMMGLSSNFGNMFSMLGAALFLPFFPMTAGQILLNNFLYDASQLAIPSDNVDEEYLSKPKHWDMKFIKKFMLIFGPISSIFDFLTFYLLYSVFGLSGSLFQTGWFIESLATQLFVIFIIRTRRIPFIQSRPSVYLIYSMIIVFLVALLLIYSPLAAYFGFSALPGNVLFTIFGLVIIYLVLVEIAKQIFYKKIYKINRL
jgi:Mg2+-importing ATPase